MYSLKNQSSLNIFTLTSFPEALLPKNLFACGRKAKPQWKAT